MVELFVNLIWLGIEGVQSSGGRYGSRDRHGEGWRGSAKVDRRGWSGAGEFRDVVVVW